MLGRSPAGCRCHASRSVGGRLGLRWRSQPALSQPDEVLANGRPVVQVSWVEVGAVGPDDGVDLAVEFHLPKEARVGNQAVELADQNGREVDRLGGPVAEFEAQREVGYVLHADYPMDLVNHATWTWVAACRPARARRR